LRNDIGSVDTDFLKSLMKVKNLSESQFAEIIGVSHSMVNRVINGNRGAGTKFIVGVLNNFEGVTIGQLIKCDHTLPKGNKKAKSA